MTLALLSPAAWMGDSANDGTTEPGYPCHSVASGTDIVTFITTRVHLGTDDRLDFRQHGGFGRCLVADVEDAVGHHDNDELLLGLNFGCILEETPNFKGTGQRPGFLL
eukprot:COSAG02_NODE_18038_length_964_cov_3.351445_1_plen_108_part_00